MMGASIPDISSETEDKKTSNVEPTPVSGADLFNRFKK
jgi:hypothetical protein